MAITSVLGGQGRVSDATLTAMLNSGDQDLINRANNYIEGAKKEAEELGKNKGILGVISDLFGFSKLAAAEPPSSQEFSNQFSVTRPSQFDFKPEPIIPGTALTDSVMKDVIDTPTREFGDIRAGFPRQGIFGNVNINPELTEEELIQKFLQTEGGDIETDPFVQQNIFQKGLNFLRETPSARVGLGAILGGPAGALAGFFANKIGGGILNAIRSFRNRGKDVEIGLPQVIQTGSEFVDEFATPNDPGTVGGSSFDTATGGTFGSSVDDASTFSDYS
jgi:hypothetical protein